VSTVNTVSTDPIVREIIRHRLDSINEEAAITLRQVSGSPVAVEANDLNTAITTADGTVVACGYYVLCQLASMNLVATDILREYSESPGIHAGDQFMTNDPYVGTLHQPDVVVVAPIFYEGRLMGWCGSSVHQFDVGGPSAGGMTFDAASIFDEPTPLPPIKVMAGGVVQRDVERDFLRRSRTPQLNELDLRGQLAANRVTVAAVQALCAKYGCDTVIAVMDGLVDAAETRLRERLTGLPDGRWRHVSYLERGAAQAGDSDVYAVRLTMTKRGDHVELDFSESSDQATGAINAAYPALVNFSVAALLIHLCGDLPWVPGALLRVVTITSREGTVAHARWPAGIAMSTASSCQAIRIAVNACVARMTEADAALAEHTMASCCSSGGGGGVFAGLRADGTGYAAMTLDELSGGGGATGIRDGISTSGTTTSPGAACADVEVNESYLPLRYLRRVQLPDSGGPGRLRGGLGGLNVIAPHGTPAPVTVLSFAQGLQHPAAIGLAGGELGRQSVYAIADVDVALSLLDGVDLGELPLPTRDSAVLAGQAHVAVSQGGGGYGDPLEREPEAVAEDVRLGLVSPPRAELDYGVVVRAGHDGGYQVDLAATRGVRDEQLRRRLGGRRPIDRVASSGRRFSDAFAIGPDGRVECRRCGTTLAAAGQDPYAALVDEVGPVHEVAPWSVAYPGGERFALHRLHCPACAVRVDVQVRLRDEPPLRAAEPLA
jgi:N-methylhydantoinase B